MCGLNKIALLLPVESEAPHAMFKIYHSASSGKSTANELAAARNLHDHTTNQRPAADWRAEFINQAEMDV